jgi:hypothetical protein
MNHFITSMARLAGSFSAAGATNTEGCSVQYDENSVRDLVERMKAGAVIVERSPLKEAIDCPIVSPCTLLKLDATHLEEARPRALCLGRDGRSFFLSHDDLLYGRNASRCETGRLANTCVSVSSSVVEVQKVGRQWRVSACVVETACLRNWE